MILNNTQSNFNPKGIAINQDTKDNEIQAENYKNKVKTKNRSKNKLNISTILQAEQPLNDLNVLIDINNLDFYIDEYLQNLKKNNPQMKEQIENNRKKFINQAINSIKNKIIEDSHRNSNSLCLKDQFNNQQGQKQKKINSQFNTIEKHQNRRKKQKHDISVLSNDKSSSNFPLLPKRHIYQKSASHQLTRIGKAFCSNQLNLLQQTITLQAKNRQRAQRVFKRKLMNMQRKSFHSPQRFQSQHLSYDFLARQ